MNARTAEFSFEDDPGPWALDFRLYCEEHGRTPTAQLAHDRDVYPGGRMTGFLSWHLERRREFNEAQRISAWKGWTVAQRQQFSAWLTERARSLAGARS